jgi:hypothetical protein
MTGSSSVFKSLCCAIELSRIVGDPQKGWEDAAERLKKGIQIKPQQFNISKSRFSMDWFYPVLSGAIDGLAAHRRIKNTGTSLS